MIGRTLAHFRILETLGSGGMGDVYLAEDTRLGRRVAVKVLPSGFESDPERIRRFVREAQAASALNHPNVATIYEICEADGIHCIAMEYVNGQTLGAKIGEVPLRVAEVLDIASQIADALDAAHTHGITHRDIKPGNIMVTPRGQIKVLDFGLAKTGPAFNTRRSASAMPTESGTDPHTVMGTVHYMSPEQAIGRTVDHRSDIFSLGSVLYQMATARLPFSGTNATETIDLIRHAEPEAIARWNYTVLPELERIIRKCLEKEVERRYQSARELLVDVRNLKRDTDAKVLDTRPEDPGVRRSHLPIPLTSFVGRDREIADLRRVVLSTRLLTLTGAGGCGKTRLALHVAATLSDVFSEGVWAVDLAPLSDPALVPQIVASALDVREGQNRSLIESLSDYVRPRHILLFLDNCEHLIGACAQLVETLLRAAPRLHVLVTSREALGVDGEAVLRVPSLALPDSAQPLAADAVSQHEAVRLFVDRARLVQPGFALNESNAKTVVEICRRLDGIPLAIELGAARLNLLSVDQIHARLEDRFRLLTGGSRTALPRQRTLEAAMTWSYELLPDVERQLLCRLSVFPSSWTLEAAEDVCAGDGMNQTDMLDLLSHLVDKSLVIVDDGATGDRRYRFLETVRQYGRERLFQSGEAARWRDRHLDFFSQLARRAEVELCASDQVAWLNRLQLEHDNLRSALEWCIAAPARGNQALEMASTLYWFWTKRGYFAEGQRWLERALAGAPEAPPALQAKALIGLSHMTMFQGDYARTQTLLEESLRLAREGQDMRCCAYSLFAQGRLAGERGDLEKSALLAAEAQAAAIASGDVWLQSLPLLQRTYLAECAGDYQQAGELSKPALSLIRQAGDSWVIAAYLADLAGLRVLQQRPGEARAVAAEAILLCQELADRRGIAWCLESLAVAEAAEARFVRAAHLWGAAEALLEGVGSSLPLTISAGRDPYLKVTRESLDERTFQAAWSEGRAMPLKEAVQYALQQESV